MTESHTNHAKEKRGFTSISRMLMTASTDTLQESENNHHHMHQRHRYLIAREAITLGILNTLFLLAAIACEFTTQWDSWIVFICIPIVTFIALHVLCLVASQLALLAKPLLATSGNWCQDIAQGVTIITLFTIYAVLRILHPIADWFTPLAWIWIGIWTIDCLGRAAQSVTAKSPTS